MTVTAITSATTSTPLTDRLAQLPNTDRPLSDRMLVARLREVQAAVVVSAAA